MKPREVLDELYNAYMNDDMCCRSQLVDEVEDIVDRLEELESKEFKWHLMDEEAPEYGMGEYLVMGPKGGLKLAHGYVQGHDGPLGAYFKTSVGGYDFIDARKVYAWAEIPPMEEAE